LTSKPAINKRNSFFICYNFMDEPMTQNN
jgi:hypothetical protein